MPDGQLPEDIKDEDRVRARRVVDLLRQGSKARAPRRFRCYTFFTSEAPEDEQAAGDLRILV